MHLRNDSVWPEHRAQLLLDHLQSRELHSAAYFKASVAGLDTPVLNIQYTLGRRKVTGQCNVGLVSLNSKIIQNNNRFIYPSHSSPLADVALTTQAVFSM